MNSEETNPEMNPSDPAPHGAPVESPPFVAAEADVIPLPCPPRPHHSWRWWWSWIVEYNPFFLLSAVSMLLGVLALSNTTTWEPVPLRTLLILLGTLEIYSLACLGIGVLLYRKLGPRRDAVQLLALVLLLAVDVSFLMSEIATESLAVGAVVSTALLLLAFAEAAVVFMVVRPALDPAPLLTGAVGLVALHAVPVVLTALDDGSGNVDVAHFYVLWWLIGLSPLLYDLYRKSLGRPADPGSGESGGESAKWLRFIAVLPWLSLAVHVGVLHYVYDRPFMAAHAAPLLVGLALLIRPARESIEVVLLRTAILAAAVFVSLPDPARLSLDMPDLGISIGTVEIGCAAAWLAFAYCNVPRLVPHFAAIGLGTLLLAWFGPTLEQVMAFARSVLAELRRLVVWLVPQTRFAWGCVAVVSAFAFLVFGTLLSLARRHPAEQKAE